MIFGVVIGLLVIFVVPIFFAPSATHKGKRKRRKQYTKEERAVKMACLIIGCAIIVTSILRSFF